MKVICAATMGAVLLTAGSAQAGEIDMSTITCAVFSALPDDQKIPIIVWLDGYYAKKDPPKTDFDKLTPKLKQLLLYCSKNPTVGLSTAAAGIVGH